MIYLYDNQLTKIENFNFAENLTHLYLQNNRLQKMENFHACPKLQKLYLGGNQIQVLEGLEQCTRLTELYIENQHLPDGEKLLFDPRTLQSLSNVLGLFDDHQRKTNLSFFFFRTEILNVSGNNLDTLGELNCLMRLQELSANNNQLENLREWVTLLSIWPRLKRLDLTRNPLCSKARYRERLIVVSNSLGNKRVFSRIRSLRRNSYRLEMLDGKSITDNSRQFLMSWKASREAQQSKDKVQPNPTDRGESNAKMTKFEEYPRDKSQPILFCPISVLRLHVLNLWHYVLQQQVGG